MGDRVSTTLHELVFVMDTYADSVLREEFGVSLNLLVFLTPLATETLDVTHLAYRLNLTKAAVSKRVPQLEREGWVRTSSDPNHRRRVLIDLTAKGRELVDKAGGLMEQHFTTVMSSTDVDLDALNGQLVRMFDTMISFLTPPEPPPPGQE